MEQAEQLLSFLEKSPTGFHAVANMREMLIGAGFTELFEGALWKLQAGGAYFVTRNGSALIAFRIPKEDFTGFSIIASHSDSPALKVKENPEMLVEDLYVKLNVEQYGGMICATWLDRPLSVAGRLVVRENDHLQETLVCVDQDLLVIPSLAIHMNRKVNEGQAIHVQKEMLPLFGEGNEKKHFMEVVAEHAQVQEKDILGADLFLYNRQKGTLWGQDREFISAPRLDDLECAFGSLQGFLRGKSREKVSVHCVFDNEEVGSMTRQGAASTFLKDTLQRINYSLGRGLEQYMTAIANSFLISADNAHALHPNYEEKSCPTNRPSMNGGIVIKYHAGQKYTTDAVSAAVIKRLCAQGNVPVQSFANHSDMAGGSTLGSIATTQTPIKAVDIGLAQLAMHSAFETAGTRDIAYLVKLAERFYKGETSDDGVWFGQ